MKVKFCSRCNGMHEASAEIVEMPDESTDPDLKEEAYEQALIITGFEYWYEKVEEVKDGKEAD